jgi:hypothetical protein
MDSGLLTPAKRIGERVSISTSVNLATLLKARLRASSDMVIQPLMQSLLFATTSLRQQQWTL